MSKYIVDIHGEIEGDYEIVGKYEEQEPTTNNDLSHNLCDSCTNIRCEFQSGIVRTKCAFYMPPQHSSGLEKNSKKLENPTTKNDLGVDCVARQDVERYIEGFINEYTPKEELEFINLELDGLKHIPSVTPQEPRKGHWIEVLGGCKCSCCDMAFSRLKETCADNYCPNCGADMREVEE